MVLLNLAETMYFKKQVSKSTMLFSRFIFGQILKKAVFGQHLPKKYFL